MNDYLTSNLFLPANNERKEEKIIMEKVLVSGGSGLIGSHLCRKLKEKGYSVACLTRTRSQVQGIQTYTWDVDKHEF
jgi:short-subunit dehydrogenase